MEVTRALELARRWKETGKVCTHPNIVIETHRGSKTGDKVCTTCGQDFPLGKITVEKRD